MRNLSWFYFLLAGWRAWAASPELLSHDLDVRVEPAEAGLEVIDRIRISQPEARDSAVAFVLNRALELGGVSLEGKALEWRSLPRWRPRDFFEKPDYAELGAWSVARQHEIHAPQGGWPAGELEIEIRYAGAVYDSLRAPEVAYSRGFETTSGLIDPRGAFLSFESFWVPWMGDGRFHFRLATRLPLGWHSMSQGRRVRHGEFDGDSVTEWQSEAPQELVYLVAGPYTIRERQHGPVSLYTYTYADTPEDLCNSYLDAAAGYLDRYGDSIAPYGFSKWAMVENWWQTGFGMPGFTLLGDKVIRLPFIVDTSYGHEILHCWWGNGVYVDYDSGNWCEGLTAYGADYAYKLEQSDAAARDYRRDTLTGYLDFASSDARDFPLREFRQRSDYGTQAIGYGKCLMVFHMLEQLVGHEAFERALQLFYERFEFQFASWDDIQAVFSEVHGSDLSGWFSDWVDRTGAAKLSIASLNEGPEGWELQLHQDGDSFPLRVPISWRDSKGEHSAVIDMPGNSASFSLPQGLEELSVDPDYHLFRELHRDEIPPTLSQVLGADSTLVVLGADSTPELRSELRRVAEGWAENQDMRIVEESELDAADLPARSLFLLGPGPLVDETFASAETTLGEAPRNLLQASHGQSLIACFRDPRDKELGRAVVLPAGASVAEALGRKIPHYSRYSWLTFEGEQNVGKGAWKVLSSPLRRTLEEKR